MFQRKREKDYKINRYIKDVLNINKYIDIWTRTPIEEIVQPESEVSIPGFNT